MADNILIDGLIKFCDEKSKNIKLKAEPQVFVEIKQALEELKELRKGIKEIPIATITIDKEDLQRMVDEKVAQIELDIQEIRAKAIDEFTEALKERLKGMQMLELQGEDVCPCAETGGCLYMNCDVGCQYCAREQTIKDVEEIAEQLKAGGAE